MVSKHEYILNVKRRSPERFIAIVSIECFDTMIKHAEQVVEIASQTPFTPWQKFPDSSLIRDVLTSDSFYRLHEGT